MGFLISARNALFLALSMANGANTSPVQPPAHGDRELECKQLSQKLKLEKTTVIGTTYVPVGANLTISAVPSCNSFETPANRVEAAFCRVHVRVETSARSSVDMEAWLPDEWYGRFLGVGNGGLGGCINYQDLNNGVYHHFATVGTNNGHDGDTAVTLLNNPDRIKDFAYRSITTEVSIGKQIVSTYYNRPLGKSYYNGCSTGGRQGFKAIQDYPDLFDGVVAGSPALDFNRLLSASGYIGDILGLDPDSLITTSDFSLLSKDVLAQCDALDGVLDGIIDDPDMCIYRPEKLLCDPTSSNSASNSTASPSSCFSREKVEAVRALFSSFYGAHGEEIFPRLDPGATGSMPQMIFGPGKYPYLLDWYRYVIYNDTSFTGDNLTSKDVYFADKVNPGGISTFNPDISAFRDRGGKVISYHGTQDQLIPLGNSIRYFNNVAQTLSTPDPSFYKLFRIPGMAHCAGGPGAWGFGQSSTTPLGLKNDTSSNVLLAIVEWVEGGKTPEMIVGTKFVGDNPKDGIESQRIHCPYPSRSKLIGKGDWRKAESWVCV